MQTHKRLIARILSLVITSSMVLTTLPLSVLASDELSEKTEIIQESDKENSENGGGLVSKSTDGTGGTEGETLGLVEGGTDTGNEGGTNNLDNDFDISSGNVKIEDVTGDCSEENPHVITGETEEFYIYVTTGTHFIELKGVDINPTGATGSTALGIASNATVNLILASENNILTAGFGAGITVPYNANLNISGTGSLEVTGATGAAGIGGRNLNADAGTITIEGGTITATGGSNGAGIGGGQTGSGGNITIKGGTVVANGGSRGAGIGSGYNSKYSQYVNGGIITIEGGNITATGGPSGAGIGGGKEGEGGTITINDGTVTAKGGEKENDTEGGGAGIGGGYNGAGGTITISGTSTKVTATGGSHANGGGAGIGSGFIWPSNTSVNGGTIAISGGEVKATGGMQGAGIGGGAGGNDGTITISRTSTKVTATGGSSDYYGGAGIGGGKEGTGGKITIDGGTIIAIGGKYAAGIGGGSDQTGGTITIDGGTIIATGGSNGAAGIGGGYTGAGGDITITNGIITANGIDGGAGIGGGWGKSGGTIKISGSDTSVTATGGGSNSNGGAGIGDGYIIKDENVSASVSISAGASVTAVSIGDSSAILGEIKDINTYIMQLDFLNEVAANSNIKVLNASEEKASYTPTINFKSIALNVPKGNYTAKLAEDALEHSADSTYSEEFTISNSGLNKFNNVRVKVGGSTEPDEPVTPPVDPDPDNPGTPENPNPTPTPPSTGGLSSNTSNNIGAEGTESGSNVQVTTTRTPDEVKNIIEDKYIIDTIEIKKAEEPVKIKIKVDKKKTKDIFVVQTNPETKKVELVAKSEVDNKGYAEFMTDSKEKLTIVTQLYVGFIDTVATVVKPSVTYYIDETPTFKKGWFKLEDKDWYFADYLSEEVQKNRWVADGEDSNKLAKWYYLGEDGVMFEGKWIANDEDGTKWYYVDQNGLFLRDTVIDGYVINSEGYWSK